MLNSIYSEFFKLKRTYILPVIFISSIFMSAVMFLARIVTKTNMSFEKYAYNIEQSNYIILFIVLFSIISSYVFSREFLDKTADTLYGYSSSRVKIFMSKLIVTDILIFLTYFIELVSIIISYYFLNASFPETKILINELKINGLSMFFQFLIIPIPVLISVLSRNVIIPMTYGILGFILSFVFGTNGNFDYVNYIPIISPWLSVEYLNSGSFDDIKSIMIYSILCFIFFMSISIYNFCRRDIN